MINVILYLIHNTVILFSGVFTVALLINIPMNKKNIIHLTIFSLLSGALLFCSYSYLGMTMADMLYPLIIHLPLVLFYKIRYKKRLSVVFVAITIAYLICQISNWAGIVVLGLFNSDTIYYLVRIVVTGVTFYLIGMMISKQESQLLNKPTSQLLILGLMPIMYYVFDYATTVYSQILYSGRAEIVESLAFGFAMTYLLFLFLYYYQLERVQSIEQHNNIMEMQLKSSESELEAIKDKEYELSIMRHDMRHYLNNINALLNDDDVSKAKDYIKELNNSLDHTVIHQYTTNSLVNSVISIYANKCGELDVAFNVDIKVKAQLIMNEVSFNTILSNGLENALNATLLCDTDKHIDVSLKEKNNKILLRISNTYKDKPILVDGIPISNRPGHGIGTQSIIYATEKLNGNCQFIVEEDVFILRIII